MRARVFRNWCKMVFVYLRADKFNSNGSIKDCRVRLRAVWRCDREEKRNSLVLVSLGDWFSISLS